MKTEGAALSQDRPVFFVHCSVVIRRADGQVLLVREGKEDNCYGRWNLPGGHLDNGEDVVVGAQRECREETLLDLSMQALIGVFPSHRAVRMVFLADADGRIPRAGDEILEVMWRRPEDIIAMPSEQLVSPGNLRQVLERLMRGETYPLSVVEWFRPN